MFCLLFFIPLIIFTCFIYNNSKHAIASLLIFWLLFIFQATFFLGVFMLYSCVISSTICWMVSLISCKDSGLLLLPERNCPIYWLVKPHRSAITVFGIFLFALFWLGCCVFVFMTPFFLINSCFIYEAKQIYVNSRLLASIKTYILNYFFYGR